MKISKGLFVDALCHVGTVSLWMFMGALIQALNPNFFGAVWWELLIFILIPVIIYGYELVHSKRGV